MNTDQVKHRAKVVVIRDRDGRLHVRIARWNVGVQAYLVHWRGGYKVVA